MEWFIIVLKKYAIFEGRARRKEYWMFTLISAIIGYVFLGIDFLTDLKYESIGLLSSIYNLFIIIPSLAVMVRRFHDINKSGWNFLWALLPVFGWIYLLILTIRNGDEGENQYGPDPKNPRTELNDIGTSQI